MNFIKKVSAIAFVLVFALGTQFIYAQEFDAAELLEQRNAKPITDSELKSFSSVYLELAQINQESQERMISIIEKNGMELERFSEIQMALMQNQEPNTTEKEMDQIDKITKEFDKVQPEIQAELEKSVTQAGLTIERVNDIILSIQSDKTLRDKLQTMMSGK